MEKLLVIVKSEKQPTMVKSIYVGTYLNLHTYIPLYVHILICILISFYLNHKFISQFILYSLFYVQELQSQSLQKLLVVVT